MQALQPLRQTIDRWLYPDLGQVAPRHGERAMHRARSEGKDTLEICGLVAALTVATYLTRYSLKEPTFADRVSFAVANFVVAIPQLVLFAGPFPVRRTRRVCAPTWKMRDRKKVEYQEDDVLMNCAVSGGFGRTTTAAAA